jgi:aryl-alcohol dehydrogenase-like predicted oxidoreductase
MVTLSTTKLGKVGPIVGIQGLGCMAMATDYYGPTDEQQSRATLEHALDRGVTLFDTADAYGFGKNEEFIGPFVRANRNSITIATKFGIVRTPGSDLAKAMIENRPEHIRSAVEASLRRLGIDVIDLYYMHRRNPAVPLGESVGAMADLVAAGKVRFLGLSEVSADELREAHAIHPITAVQSEWSLFSRQIEDSVVPAAAELGIGIVPYSPLGRGQLTGVDRNVLGKNDVRQLYGRFAETDNPRLVGRIGAIAARHSASSAQVALAWLHHQSHGRGVAIVPIPGTRKPARVDENLESAVLRLSPDDLAVLEPLAAAVKGIRTMTAAAL